MPQTKQAAESSEKKGWAGGGAAFVQGQVQSASSSSTGGGNALAVNLVLSNWENFGLAERIFYHFDLIQALTSGPKSASAKEDGQQHNEETKTEKEGQVAEAADETPPKQIVSSVPSKFQKGLPPDYEHKEALSGVVSLLECVPTVSWNFSSPKNRRLLRTRHRRFNKKAALVREEQSIACYTPSELPLRLSPATRVMFSYELTRIAFCIDASPSLVSTFGHLKSEEVDDYCCPLDRLRPMAQKYFAALAEVLPVPNVAKREWKPQVSVTVIAVYPSNPHEIKGESPLARETSLLVRDFRLYNAESAKLLATRIGQWAVGEVENSISQLPSAFGASEPLAIKSSLHDILEAADVALGAMAQEARPVIVVATDCRSVVCDNIVDIAAERNDVPIHILDLSSPDSHKKDTTRVDSSPVLQETNSFSMVQRGPLQFPLYCSDDSGSLHFLSNATGGCFLDIAILDEAISSHAGQVLPASPLSVDHYFSFRRWSVRPNAIQWYTLFSLSPISPVSNSSWGRMPPPVYIRKQLERYESTHDPAAMDPASLRDSLHSEIESMPEQLHSRFTRSLVAPKPPPRTPFSVYFLSRVRIKGLLLMRAKAGYRARKYGHNTQDPDKVSIQFTLQLEYGTVLHYEVSYVSSSHEDPLLGSANVKIELSGDPAFIQAVKNDSMSHQQLTRASTIAKRNSWKLCSFLRWVRKEDSMQHHLCPVDDSASLSLRSSFLSSLESLSRYQRQQHFRRDEFDLLCTGEKSQGDNEGLFSEFIEVDNGEKELFQCISAWTSETLRDGRLYVKRIDKTRDNINTYCIIEVTPSAGASRLFTITADFFGGITPLDRIDSVGSLKARLSECTFVALLPQRIRMRLAVPPTQKNAPVPVPRRRRLVQSLYQTEHWNMIKNAELVPLLVKRRNEIEKFLIVDSSESGALFVRFEREKHTGGLPDEPDVLCLVQYQISTLQNEVRVTMLMDSQGGRFSPLRRLAKHDGKMGRSDLFENTQKRVSFRDGECAKALGSRTNLLSAFDQRIRVDNDVGPSAVQIESAGESVGRLLAYASSTTKRLRFFHPGAESANSILEDLTTAQLLSGFGNTRVAELWIATEQNIPNIDEGKWFLVQYDSHTFSIAHFASNEKEEGESKEESFVYRELTLYTIGTADLYCTRDMVDDSDYDHISEYLMESEFADNLESCHFRNYARAAYMAMCIDPPSFFLRLHPNDLEYALASVSFQPIASVFVEPENSRPFFHLDDKDEAKSKLLVLIESMLTPVPGNNEYFFFHDAGTSEHVPIDYETSSLVLSVSTDEEDLDIGTVGTTISADDDGGALVSIAEEEVVELADEGGAFTSINEEAMTPSDSAPIFVRLTLSDEMVGTSALESVAKRACLTAEVSIFKNDMRPDLETPELPDRHAALGKQLNSSLCSYEAEQTLERLRYVGASIEDVDWKAVKKSLREARNKGTASVMINFYSTKTDSMVPASSPAIVHGTMDESFALLHTELERNTTWNMKPTSWGTFFVVDQKSGHELSFWCILQIKRKVGVAGIEIFHPNGTEEAMRVALAIRQTVIDACHLVNQLLLLKSMHESRSASILLLETDEEEPGNAMATQEDAHRTSAGLFHPGHFGCPVMFRRSFKLFHRCANQTVIHALEAEVLHSFALSNRRSVFVYKDESDAIFYMKLDSEKSPQSSESDNVHLLVFGVKKPDASITEQLTRLIEKKILSISVETISAVLQKNPQFSLLPMDTAFLRSFGNDWERLEGGENSIYQNDRLYEFPSVAFDPVLILVYFRQNICGSSFFHRLHEGGVEDMPEDRGQTQERRSLSKGQSTEIDWDVRDLWIFYNNSPSPMDSSYCTLTDKGAEYSRKTGRGIAIIEFDLLQSTSSPSKKFAMGVKPEPIHSLTNVPLQHIRFINCESTERQKGSSSVCLHVKIVNTTLDVSVLHEWILLTLNQVLVAWYIERHLERVRHGLIARALSSTGLGPSQETNNGFPFRDRSAIDNLCRGLPALLSVLDNSYGLSHPAIGKFSFYGKIRATTLQKHVIDPLQQVFSGPLRLQNIDGVRVIRTSSAAKPVMYNVSKQGNTLALEQGRLRGKCAIDGPMDDPTYVCFLSTVPDKDHRIGTGIHSSSLLFREVLADDGVKERRVGGLNEQMSRLRDRYPSALIRSFAFIFAIKRTERSVFTYNWNPKKLESFISRVDEMESSKEHQEEQQRTLLVRRCMQNGIVCGNVTAAPTIRETPAPSITRDAVTGLQSVRNDSSNRGVEEKKSKPEPVRETVPPSLRKVKIPKVIRRPKLVGTSVDGDALKAVAASRARASSTRGLRNSASSKPSKAAPGNTRMGTSRAGGKATTRHPPVEEPRETGRGGRQSIDAAERGKSSQGANKTVPANRQDNDTVVPETEQEDSLLAALRKDRAIATALTPLLYLPQHSNMQSAQMLLSHLIRALKTSAVSIEAVDFVLEHCNLVWCSSCEMPQQMRQAVSIFPSYVAKCFADTTSDVNVILAAASGAKPLSTKGGMRADENTVVFAKETRKSRHRQMLFVRVSTKWDRFSSKLVSYIKVWVMPHVIEEQADAEGPAAKTLTLRRNNKGSRGKLSSEGASNSLERMASKYIDRLNIESQVYNYTTTMLDSIIGGVYSPETFEHKIFGKLISRFPQSKQRRLPGLKYRFIDYRVELNMFQDNFISRFEATALFQNLYLMENPQRRLFSSGGAKCIAGAITGYESLASFFLMHGQSGRSSFDLFILCRTDRGALEDFFFTPDSPIGITLLNRIIYKAFAVLREMLFVAAMRLRRLNVWKCFSSESEMFQSPSRAHFNELCYLASMSSLEPGESVSISSIFRENRDEIQWPMLLMAMKQDPVFSRLIVYEESEHTLYVIYLKLEDVLLVFEAEAMDQMKFVAIDDDATERQKKKQRAAEIFANYVVQWMWQNL